MKTYKWAELRADLSPEAQARVDERVKATLAEMDKPLVVTLEGDVANTIRIEAAERETTPEEVVSYTIRSLEAVSF